MAIYFLVVFGFYFLLLLLLLAGWKKAFRRISHPLANEKFISIVVAMRNEREHIKNLLLSLSKLRYSATNFEIILVDDHSVDGSEIEAGKWQGRIPSMRIVSLSENEKGKKAALSIAIGIAKGELIAATDADCVVPSDWLERINASFHSPRTNLCVGLVALQDENTFFGKLQSIEFASVMSTSISMVAMGKPIMCNGANLSFRKRAFDEVGGYAGNEHIASGDDEFLLRKIEAKYPHSIRTLTDGVVVTKPQPNLKDFLYQRLRWASKWKHNPSTVARLLAVFILVVQWSWLMLNVLLIFYPSSIFVGLLVLKVLLDWILLASVSRSLGMKFDLVAFAAVQLFYPLYVLYVGIFSQKRNHQWKGRGI